MTPLNHRHNMPDSSLAHRLSRKRGSTGSTSSSSLLFDQAQDMVTSHVTYLRNTHAGKNPRMYPLATLDLQTLRCSPERPCLLPFPFFYPSRV
ncbi:hypothetical protein DTO063F5_3989 [Paecilomyces variotii]|nr:hypothetical protein DTO063F5_3989 [Paecilomyces variotii]